MWKMPDFQPGNRPSASKLQQLSNSIELLSNSLSANGSTSSCGILSAETLPESFWVRVLGNDGGSPPAHYWQQVLDADEDGNGPVDKKGGLIGDPESIPLYEINGGSISEGTIVRAWRGLGDWYYASNSYVRGLIEVDSALWQGVTLPSGHGLSIAYPAIRKAWKDEDGTWNPSYAIWCICTSNSSFTTQPMPGVQYEAFLVGEDENRKEIWGINEQSNVCFFKAGYTTDNTPIEAEWLGRVVRNCSNTQASSEITTTEDSFVSEDVGKTVTYPYFTGTITAVSSPTSCTVSNLIPYENTNASLSIGLGKTFKAWGGVGYDSGQGEGTEFFKSSSSGYLYFANGEYPQFDKYYIAHRCGLTIEGQTVWAAETADSAIAVVTSLSYKSVSYNQISKNAYPCKVFNVSGTITPDGANGWLVFSGLTGNPINSILRDGDKPSLNTAYLCKYLNAHAVSDGDDIEYPVYYTCLPTAASVDNWGVITNQPQTLKGDKTLLGDFIAQGNISASDGTGQVQHDPNNLGWLTGKYLGINGEEFFGGYANVYGKPTDNAVAFIGGNTIYPNGGIYNLGNPGGDSVDPRTIDIPDPKFLALCGPSNDAYGSYAAAVIGVGQNNIIINGGCNFGTNEDGTITYQPPMQPGIFIATGGKQVECATGMDAVGNYFVSGLCISVGGSGDAAGGGWNNSSSSPSSANPSGRESIDDGSFW